MKEISQAISILLPTFYLGGLFFYGMIFFSRTKRIMKYTPHVLIFLVLLHGTTILLRGLVFQVVPLSSKSDALSFLAFTILLIYIIIEFTFKNRATGFLLMFVPFILQVISSLFYNWELTVNPLLKNPVFAFHVVMTLSGYSAISISAVYALMYVMLNRNLKSHKLGLIYENLPPLMILERMSIRSVKIGIFLLGFGILLGHLRANVVIGSPWPMDPKVLVSDFMWLFYFIGLFVSYLRKWRGMWMAYLSLSGFGIIILSNIALLFYEQSFHRFM